MCKISEVNIKNAHKKAIYVMVRPLHYMASKTFAMLWLGNWQQSGSEVESKAPILSHRSQDSSLDYVNYRIPVN